jgi:hypothetical protein
MKTKHSFYNMYRTAGDERERERELAVVWPNNMCLPACLPACCGFRMAKAEMEVFGFSSSEGNRQLVNHYWNELIPQS